MKSRSNSSHRGPAHSPGLASSVRLMETGRGPIGRDLHARGPKSVPAQDPFEDGFMTTGFARSTLLLALALSPLAFAEGPPRPLPISAP